MTLGRSLTPYSGAGLLGNARYFRLVPREMGANEAYRVRVRALAEESDRYRRSLLWMCRCDPLFYVNTFYDTCDPRRVSRPAVPFLTCPVQDGWIMEMLGAFGMGEEAPHDLWHWKSRGVGASWTGLAACDWAARFHEGLSFLWASKKKELVDAPADDLDALFPRLRWAWKRMPDWLGGGVYSTQMRFSYQGTGSQIRGEATVDDIGRAGRQTAVLLDEFAMFKRAESVMRATRDSTQCRVFISTGRGQGTTFYRIGQKETVRKFRTHWSDIPWLRAGLYTSRGGVLQVIDEAFWREAGDEARERYRFVLDGKDRSPWYDMECQRAESPREIAQELDMDDAGASDTFFGPELLARLRRETVCPPVLRGEVEFLPESGEFRRFVVGSSGRLRLWIPLNGGLPRRGEYVIASDPAAGGHMSSSSTITVADVRTREKVAEFSATRMTPTTLAEIVCALSLWFLDEGGGRPLVIWETNGPAGTMMGTRIAELGVPNVYKRTSKEGSTVHRSIGGKSVRIPGWHSSPRSKLALLEDYRRALTEGLFINRSDEALMQAAEYVYDGQTIEHMGSLTVEESSSRGANHGDLVISDALAWWGMKERLGQNATRLIVEEPRPRIIPPNCPAALLEREFSEEEAA